MHFLDFPDKERYKNYLVAYQGCCEAASAKIYMRSGPAAHTDSPSSRIVRQSVWPWFMGCIQDVTSFIPVVSNDGWSTTMNDNTSILMLFGRFVTPR